MPVCTKTICSLVRKGVSTAKAYLSLAPHWGAVGSAIMVAGVSWLSILLGRALGQVATPARHYLWHLELLLWRVRHDSPNIYITTIDCKKRILCSKVFWALVSHWLVDKCLTLTCINKSLLDIFGLMGHSSSQYQVDSSPIVCVVLALDSWNCYSGDQGLTAQHLPLNVYPNDFIE